MIGGGNEVSGMILMTVVSALVLVAGAFAIERAVGYVTNLKKTIEYQTKMRGEAENAIGKLSAELAAANVKMLEGRCSTCKKKLRIVQT